DMCSAKRHVRFTPNSDRDSRHPQTVMSALPPKADMGSANAHVCFGPKADIRPHSIDQFISAAEQRLRHDEAERLGGREVDYKLILGRRLHWQVGRLLALEDAIDVTCRASELAGKINAIRNQAATDDKDGVRGDRCTLRPGRECGDEFSTPKCHAPCRYYQSAIRRFREC